MVTKAARLAEVEQKQRSRLQKEQQRKQRKLSIRLAYAIGLVMITFVGKLGTPILDRNAYNKYAEAPGSNVERMAFRDDSTYLLWSETAINNDINSLVNGGYYYERDGIKICPNTTFEQTMISTGGINTPLSDSVCSYIQSRNGTIIYRKDRDRFLYGRTLDDSSERVILGIPVGETIFYENEIYYIDQNDGFLYKIALSDESPTAVSEEKVKQFIVCGDYCVFLLDGGSIKCSKKGIEKNLLSISGAYNTFYFNGNIIAQSNKVIIKFDLEGKNPEKLNDFSDNDTVRLIGAGDKCYYMELDHKVFRFSMDSDTAPTEIWDDPGDLLIGFTESASGAFGISYRNIDGKYVAEAREVIFEADRGDHDE